MSSLYGSDQKQEMILPILCLFSMNYRFNAHFNLITTKIGGSFIRVVV
jgi:hypothetical protein